MSQVRRRAARAVFGLLCLGLGSGCASIPTPRVLDEADATSRAPAAVEAKEHAAPTWAMAEKRRLEAHEALEAGPAARAQFLAEEAIALYEQGAQLARVAKASLREKGALVEAEATEKELAELEARLRATTAEVDALELRLKVARDALAPVGSGPASPEREAARREAARALLVQGRLLCAAARVFGAGSAPAPAAAPAAPPATPPAAPEDPTSPAVVSRDLAEAEAQLVELEGLLATPDKATPIDLAGRARASCLSALSRARRSASPKPDVGSADALLGEIGAMAARGTDRPGAGLEPERDERGVSVTLRNVFDGEAVAASARTRLEALDRVAAAHRDHGLAVVLHTDVPVKPADRAKLEARAAAVAKLFGSVPEARRVVVIAGDALPIVSPRGKDRGKNARVEVVFLAPEAL